MSCYIILYYIILYYIILYYIILYIGGPAGWRLTLCVCLCVCVCVCVLEANFSDGIRPSTEVTKIGHKNGPQNCAICNCLPMGQSFS